MKKSFEVDLADLVDILEGFTKKLDKIPRDDLIDLAARLKPVVKHINVIDEFAKDYTKAYLKHKEGSLGGGLFKAVLKLVETTRLDQKGLKEGDPAIHAKYNKKVTDERVSFEVR